MTLDAIDHTSGLQRTLLDYQLPDLHLGSGEDVSPWIPYVSPGVYARYLGFDLRLGQLQVILRADSPAGLGCHKHRSPVTGFTLSGSWGYREYDWVARTGDLVQESPGTIHTLYTDDEDGMAVFFILNGCIEFFDDDDNVVENQDIFWFLNHYLEHCRANDLPINERLIRR